MSVIFEVGVGWGILGDQCLTSNYIFTFLSLFRSWNADTGANAPLYDMDGSPEFSVHACVENWKAGGARPDQM